MFPLLFGSRQIHYVNYKMNIILLFDLKKVKFKMVFQKKKQIVT